MCQFYVSQIWNSVSILLVGTEINRIMDKGNDHKRLLSDTQSCEFDFIPGVKPEGLSTVLQKNSGKNTQFATKNCSHSFPGITRFPCDNDHTRAGLLLLVVVVVIPCAALEAWFQEGTNWSYVHQLLFIITFHANDWVWPCMSQHGIQHF